MPSEKEVRFYSNGGLRADKQQKRVRGYAAVFGQETEIGGFREVIHPGAFKRSIESGSNIAVLWNHNADHVLGRTKNGTLRLSEDSVGLKVEIDLPNTTVGKDAAESIGRGDVTGMSFGFIVTDDTWTERDDEKPLRTINEVQLFEVSPCAFPAYEGTSVFTRSATKAYERHQRSKKERVPMRKKTTPAKRANTKSKPRTVAKPVTDEQRRQVADRYGKEHGVRFKSFGECLRSIMMAGAYPGWEDSRLESMSRRAASGQGEAVPADGGFLVETEYAEPIMSKVYESPLLQRVTEQYVRPGANSIVVPAIDESSRATGSRWGGVRAYWLSEGETTTSTTIKFRQLGANLKKLAALAWVSDELREDVTGLDSYLQRVFAAEIRFVLEDSIVNGEGINGPLGILNADALITVDMAVGQAAATVVGDNLRAMYARFWQHGKVSQSAAWLVNPDALDQLYSIDELHLFQPASAGAPYGRLLNVPILPIEQAATLGTVGDVVLADMEQYLLARKAGLKADWSIHLKFLAAESAFRIVLRADGMPIWDKAVSPFKGSATKSPFVALETRA